MSLTAERLRSQRFWLLKSTLRFRNLTRYGWSSGRNNSASVTPSARTIRFSTSRVGDWRAYPINHVDDRIFFGGRPRRTLSFA